MDESGGFVPLCEDPVRSALLLLGGDKTGNDRWYEENVSKAEHIFEEHLKEIEQEDKP